MNGRRPCLGVDLHWVASDDTSAEELVASVVVVQVVTVEDTDQLLCPENHLKSILAATQSEFMNHKNGEGPLLLFIFFKITCDSFTTVAAAV